MYGGSGRSAPGVQIRGPPARMLDDTHRCGDHESDRMSGACFDLGSRHRELGTARRVDGVVPRNEHDLLGIGGNPRQRHVAREQVAREGRLPDAKVEQVVADANRIAPRATRSPTSPGLLERLADGPVTCSEGGYPFELEWRAYLQAGAFVPEVVWDHPDVVRRLHRDFVHAGSDVVEALSDYAHPPIGRRCG